MCLVWCITHPDTGVCCVYSSILEAAGQVAVSEQQTSLLPPGAPIGSFLRNSHSVSSREQELIHLTKTLCRCVSLCVCKLQRWACLVNNVKYIEQLITAKSLFHPSSQTCHLKMRGTVSRRNWKQLKGAQRLDMLSASGSLSFPEISGFPGILHPWVWFCGGLASSSEWINIERVISKGSSYL